MNPQQKQFSIWYIFIALWALMLFQIFVAPLFGPTEIPYSEFKAAVAAGRVVEVSITPTVVHGRMKAAAAPDLPAAKAEQPFSAVRVDDPDLIRELQQHHVKITGVIESTFL